MKKTITVLLFCVAFATSSFAQQKTLSGDEEKNLKAVGTDTTQGWKKGGIIGLSSTQNYLHQWSAGGQSSLSIGALLDLFANKKKGNNAWDNSLSLAYGILISDIGAPAVKTNDKFDITSKYGRKATEHWFYAALLNFKTQFAPGYNVANGLPLKEQGKISDFLAPGFLLASLGMDYKPNDKFTAFLSPATYRLILVMDNDLARAGAFGVQREVLDTSGNVITAFENSRSEFGGYVRMEYKTGIMKNVNFGTKLELFSNYLDSPQNIDVSWENLITLKVNENITTTIFTHLIYDDNTTLTKVQEVTDGDGNLVTPAKIGPGVQFKEVLGLNFSYKF